jgi:ABC-type phosphate/phosphonate transport system permease subunit
MMQGAAGEVAGVLRASSDTHLHLRQRLVAIGIATLGVALACTVAAYFLERHGTGTNIHNLFDAFFWCSTQLLTVSSQIKNPVTTGGKLLDIFMEAYAITVVATLAGSFGAFFHRRSLERAPAN